MEDNISYQGFAESESGPGIQLWDTTPLCPASQPSNKWICVCRSEVLVSRFCCRSKLWGFSMCLEDVGLRRGSKIVHVTKTGHLRAGQMHLHLQVLACTADNFRLHIQGLFSQWAKAIPSYWQQQLFSRLWACISPSSHLFKDTLFPFLSFHFCLWRLPGSCWWVKGLSGFLSGRREIEKLLPPSPSTFFLPCLFLLEQNWQHGVFSFCSASGQSPWWRVALVNSPNWALSTKASLLLGVLLGRKQDKLPCSHPSVVKLPVRGS